MNERDETLMLQGIAQWKSERKLVETQDQDAFSEEGLKEFRNMHKLCMDCGAPDRARKKRLCPECARRMNARAHFLKTDRAKFNGAATLQGFN